MVSFRALCLAGVACLGATVGAHAADLLLPPPPPVEMPSYVPVNLGGSVYLRGDVGIGINDLRTRDSTFDSTFNAGAAGVGYDSRSLEDSATIDLGVGYRFNNFFRADVTGEYRAASHFNAIESYSDGTQPSGRQFDVYNGSYRTVVGLINGYVDLGTWWCVTPFVGAGVGIANIGVHNLYENNPNGGFGTAPDHNQTNFAWALMAGLDFSITQNLKLELSYRYLDMGNASSGTFNCPNDPTGGCHEVQRSHLASNDVRLGFRYSFADFTPPARPVIARY